MPDEAAGGPIPKEAETEDSEFDEEMDDRPEVTKHRKLDLERLVSQPTWKEMLLDLVVKEHLDPWNIDVGVISEKYLTSIKKLQMLDLHIPANLILAASILLRFKSDAVKLEEEVQSIEPETFIGDGQPVEIPMLTLKTRIPPKRKVTLDELVQALEEVFDDQKHREDLRNRPVIEERMVVALPEFNIEREMEEVFSRVQSKADAEGLVTFSGLLKDDSRQEKIYTLLPLLFLSQSGRVNIFQEKFFGEIFVQILKEGEEPVEKARKPSKKAKAA